MKAVSILGMALFLATPAFAEESIESTALAETARTQGRPTTEYRTYARSESNGTAYEIESQLRSNLASLGFEGTIKVSPTGERLAARAPKRTMFQRLAEASEVKLTIGELELLSQPVLTAVAAALHLTENEGFWPIRSVYETAGGASEDAELTPKVLSSRIFYGRQIEGVPVVDESSIVVVSFSPSGQLESLQARWPSYAPGESQRLDSADASSLMSKVGLKVWGAPHNVLDLACGYVNLNESLVSGCAYAVVLSNTSDGILWESASTGVVQ